MEKVVGTTTTSDEHALNVVWRGPKAAPDCFRLVFSSFRFLLPSCAALRSKEASRPEEDRPGLPSQHRQVRMACNERCSGSGGGRGSLVVFHRPVLSLPASGDHCLQ